MEPTFGDAAFAFLERTGGMAKSDLYHTGIDFEAWDQRRGQLRFRISGSGNHSPDQGVNERLSYHLPSHTFFRSP